MANFTLPISAIGGPVIRVVIMPSNSRTEALNKAGKEIPAPQVIVALVDTGASVSAVDPTVLKSLQLTPTGSTAVHTPSSGSKGHTSDLYDVRMLIYENTDQPPLDFPTMQVLACDLAVQGIQALIGRDVLSKCLLVYNGKHGEFTLGF